MNLPEQYTAKEFTKYVKIFKNGRYIGQCRYIFSDAAWRFLPIDTKKKAGPKATTWTKAVCAWHEEQDASNE